MYQLLDRQKILTQAIITINESYGCCMGQNWHVTLLHYMFYSPVSKICLSKHYITLVSGKILWEFPLFSLIS